MYKSIKPKKIGFHLVIFSYFFTIAHNVINSTPSAVTYQLGDRLGDNLASYCHARWLSYIHKIDCVYTPFKESEALAFSRIHRSVILVRNGFRKVERFHPRGSKIDPMNIGIQKDANILYIVPYFPETRYDAVKEGLMHFDIDWNNEEFMKLIRSEISPIHPPAKLGLPNDRITVAVHVRRGSGPDQSKYNWNARKQPGTYFVENYPLRFPHDSFFIEQIRRLSEMLNDQPMYVHIFTDDKNAAALIEKYAKEVGKPNIIYNSRPNQTDHSAYILQDFFDMMSFDCIIRPESHYSQISSRLSRAKIVIRPEEFIWKNRDLIITKVETIGR